MQLLAQTFSRKIPLLINSFSLHTTIYKRQKGDTVQTCVNIYMIITDVYFNTINKLNVGDTVLTHVHTINVESSTTNYIEISAWQCNC